jgi:uncharacterized membrane protein (DUF2068 family)
MHEYREIPLEERHGHSLFLVRLIALGKLFKAACLLVVGGFILHSMQQHSSVYDMLHDVINAMRIDEHNEFIHGLLEKSLGVKPRILPWLSAGTLFYSALYGTEGFGLLFDKGWAEWMTVISTAGFIPLEIFEIFHHPTITRLVIFVINVLVLVYISMRLRWRHMAKHVAKAQGAPVVIPRETLPTGIKP